MQPTRRLAPLLATVLVVGACQSTSELPAPPPIPSEFTTGSPMPTFGEGSVVGQEPAAGFPPELAALPPETQIVASAAEPGDPTTRVSLTLRSDLTAEDVMAHYVDLLGSLGFTLVPMEVPTGLVGLAGFSRIAPDGVTTETLTVAILDDGATRSVSVSGDVVPAPGSEQPAQDVP